MLLFWSGFGVRKLVLVAFPTVAAYCAWEAVPHEFLKLPEPYRAPARAALVISVTAIVIWDAIVDYRLLISKRKMKAMQSQRGDVIRRVLETYVHTAAAFQPSARLRANVMERTASGRLKITHSARMQQQRDLDISFKVGEGCCGIAWKRREQMVADFTTGTVVPYKLTAKQDRLVAPDRRWFLSTPVLSLDGSKVLAVVNLDSDKAVVGAHDAPTRQRLLDLAVTTVQTLVPLLQPEVTA